MTIVHHDDLDGIFTAIMVGLYFKTTTDGYYNFVMAGYTDDIDEIIKKASEDGYVVVCDLPPHSSARVCIDHHRSNAELAQILSHDPTKTIIFGDNAPSAAFVFLPTLLGQLYVEEDKGSLVDGLYRAVDEVSIVDFARYESFEDAIAPRDSLCMAYTYTHLSPQRRSEAMNRCVGYLQEEPYTKSFWITICQRFADTYNYSIKAFQLRDSYFQLLSDQIKQTRANTIRYGQWLLTVLEDDELRHNFAPYCDHRDAVGSIIASRHKSGVYSVHMGLNPFDKKTGINCGEIAGRHGGGGHLYASGWESKTAVTYDDLKTTIDKELS